MKNTEASLTDRCAGLQAGILHCAGILIITALATACAGQPPPAPAAGSGPPPPMELPTNTTGAPEAIPP